MQSLLLSNLNAAFLEPGALLEAFPHMERAMQPSQCCSIFLPCSNARNVACHVLWQPFLPTTIQGRTSQIQLIDHHRTDNEVQPCAGPGSWAIVHVHHGCTSLGLCFVTSNVHSKGGSFNSGRWAMVFFHQHSTPTECG